MFAPEGVSVSGSVVQGFRILPIKEGAEAIALTVYCGDYIKFKIDRPITNPVLSILQFSIEEKILIDLANASYYKKKTRKKIPVVR